MNWTKKQEIKFFKIFGKHEAQTTKNFLRNCKMKFGNLERNTIKHIIDFLHFGTRPIKATRL